MRAINRILCPTDLAVENNEALRYGVALAKAFEAKLFVCHFLENIPLSVELKIQQSFPERLNEHLAQISASLPEVESIVRAIEPGEPAFAIVQEAEARNIDLIVMQSRRRPVAASLLGSTAESVCQTARCPVFVTHPLEHEFVDAATGEIHLKRILVADDFSDDSQRAIQWGTSLAEEFQSELHLLHVLRPQTEAASAENATFQSDRHDIYQLAESELRSNVSAEASLWCEIKAVVREGKPEQEILSYARESTIDLICVGSHGEGAGLKDLLGTTSDRVLRQAPCPVLVVRWLSLTES